MAISGFFGTQRKIDKWKKNNGNIFSPSFFKFWRHGDRTPNSICPNDPNNESTWPEGLGQLTAVSYISMFQAFVCFFNNP